MESEVTDIATICEPKSDQLNADDLIEPQVYTLRKITKGPFGKKGDQPLHIHLVEFTRGPWKPPVTMRRVLREVWGKNPAEWPDGARVELFNDRAVTFGEDNTGGVRISGMSHLGAKQRDVIVTPRRGKRQTYTLRLIDAARPPADLDAVLATEGLTLADLDAWAAAHGKPPASGLDADAKAKTARWIANNPAVFDEIRAAAVTP